MTVEKFWIIDENGKKVRDRLDFVDVGVNLLCVKTLNLVLKNAQFDTPLVLTLNGDRLKFFSIATDAGVTEITQLTDKVLTLDGTTATTIDSSYKTIQVLIGWSPTIEESLTNDDIVLVSGINEDEGLIISSHGSSVDLNDRHIILLQNMKRHVSEEYIRTTKEYDDENQTIDTVLVNEKNREFLLNLFGLTVPIGSYDHLYSVLSFFGWLDDVTIKEYWKSIMDENQWKHTDVTHTVADVFTFEDGWKKTNLLGLFYELNEPDGTNDTDGIPNYVRVTTIFRSLYIKMMLLKKILQRDFLPDNVRIIDVVGEHTSFAGIDTNIFLNIVNFITVDLNDDLTDDTLTLDIISAVQNTIFITEHKALVPSSLYTVENGEMVSNGPPSHLTDTVFAIEAVDEELDTFDWNTGDFELLSKFYRADFALFQIQIIQNKPIPSIYYAYKLIIEKKVDEFDGIWNQVVMTDNLPIATLSDVKRYGIKTIGTYRVLVYLLDSYGGWSNATIELQVKMQDSILQVDLMRPKYLTDGSTASKFRRHLHEIDTYWHTEGIEIFDAMSDESVDVAYKNYADISKIDNTAIDFIRLIDLNLVQLGKLTTVPIMEYGRFYEIHLIDVIGDESETERSIKLKKFAGHDWDAVNRMYGDGGTGLQWLKQYCLDLQTFAEFNTNSVFANYTFHPILVSLDGTPENSKAMLLMFCKEQDYELGYQYYEGPEIFGSNTIAPFGKVDATVAVEVDRGINDMFTGNTNLVVKLNDVTVINAACLSLQEFYDMLKAYEIANHRKLWVQKTDTRILVSSATHAIKIEHESIGYYHEILRSSHIENFYNARVGDDFSVGSVVFAQINEENKFDNGSIVWKIYDSLSGQMIHENHNKILRFAFMNEGIFDLEVSIYDLSNNLSLSTKKIGAIRITG